MLAAYVNAGKGHKTMYRDSDGASLEIEHSDPQAARSSVDYQKLKEIGKQLLVCIGEDVNRPGLQDTPRRFADWWREFIEYNPGNTETVFHSTTSNQMVVVSGMRVWSLCEHHLLPFWCDISIGYIPGDVVLGLSKFGRIAHKYAHSLQVQERLTQQIADEVKRITRCNDVAVVGSGQHLCMTMRGVQTPATMKSNILSGQFQSDLMVQRRFFEMLGD